MVLETAVLFVLMLSVCKKANVFSIFYLFFIIRYLTSQAKTQLLVHITVYITICFLSQYLLYLLNFNENITPQKFPRQFKDYPKDSMPDTEMGIKYSIPLFFNMQVFKDLELDYFLGIGVAKIQINNLLLDFVNLFLVSIYLLNFRNPILIKSMKKVFWEFPTSSSSLEQIKRLDPKVWKQVQW
jgi:hypothetical protein